MICRAPHFGLFYQSDNIMVWNVVRHVFHGGPGWSWIQDYQVEMDSRSAYMSVKTHYLGESFSSPLRSNADAILCDVFYDGRPRGYTFERYCEVLKGAFTDLESIGELVFEGCKVRVLLQRIIDMRLDSAKSQVLATPALKATFEGAVNLSVNSLTNKSHMHRREAVKMNLAVLLPSLLVEILILLDVTLDVTLEVDVVVVVVMVEAGVVVVEKLRQSKVK
jgi:hypothetical protein